MKTSGDNKLNPALASQVQGLRGVMAKQGEKYPLPPNLTVESHPDRPAMVFTDSETGKQSVVGLCDYQGVRQFLSEMAS